MSTIELRKKWIKSIAKVDERFLRMIDALYKSYAQKEMDIFEDLPQEIQDLLLQSRESVKHGKVFSHKEVMEQSKRKYNIT